MRVAPCAAPEVTVVMAVHDAPDWTARALAALVEHTPPCFELSIFDDGSRLEATRSLLGSVEGARLERSAAGIGFGPASNRAAAGARGTHLLFLNSDAVVSAGWLEPLLERIAADGVGAVGPMLLNADGTVQQAGALTSRDGGTAVYGFGGDPADPVLTFPRTVDYVAGACLLVRRELFEAAGGLDDRYAPAYFEDADLCFKFAADGWRTVYEPRSRVLHGLGQSYDAAAVGTIASRNRLRFEERWRDVLAGRPESFADLGELTARDAPMALRILDLTGSGAAPAGARVTTFGQPSGRLDVEVLDGDPAALIAARPAHYDAVVGDGFDAELARWQPQAARMADMPSIT